ncbi:hypothetical protein [Planotetraspora sp. GP83]|uniref:hypothetical protein n=1 Tax=Planotetraspora sp. GP83 TaxID=3156264 RepID=UPI003512E06D
MKSIRRLVSVSLAAALVTGGLTALSSPASADAANCTNGANGFTNIPYNKTGTRVDGKTADLGGGRRVELHKGIINGVEHGWAIIMGATRAGDLVWMDWTSTYANGWVQCGPFTVQGDSLTNTSAAKNTSPAAGYWFRACGRRVGGPSVCGAWW